MDDNDDLEALFEGVGRAVLAVLVFAALARLLNAESRSGLQMARPRRAVPTTPPARAPCPAGSPLRLWNVIKMLGVMALCLVACLCGCALAFYRLVLRKMTR